ncbi:hypothetical protein BTA51_26235 [Hahella sp. CCB-MM4]|uniref:hypothetical protein n=1 Tax=Hahella sp. (strain CCB-MM4) TaxID=1926491 RepID=UPI000B9B02E4|nr:hypothetical protein [Hahella sp. CCB-MM4]OZG70345.1 hypothetical protein BTA51_26235 [Hahella sp. CCB-MM4]
MRELELKVSRSAFNMLWCSLHDREAALLRVVEKYGIDSDEGADALNDVTALRCYMAELKDQAEKVFDANAFIIEDEYL